MSAILVNSADKTSLSIPKKNYNGIDLVKFVCTLLMIIIHVSPFPKDMPWLMYYISIGLKHYICRLAVPFFFMASGFFLFKKMDFCNINKDAVQNYCFNILRLLGTWSVLLFTGDTDHLWYMGATVVAVVLISVLLHKGINYKYLLVIAGVLYIIGLLGDSYYAITEHLKDIRLIDYLVTIYEALFRKTRTGVFMGLPFVLIGALFAQRKIRMNKAVAVTGFCVSMLLLFFEVAGLRIIDSPKDYNMYIFLVPATTFLFYIAANLNLKDRPIYKKLRAAGVLIYFLHLLVKKLITYGFEQIKDFFGIDCFPYLFVSTVAVTVALAFLIEFLSNKENCKWMKWLYS